MKFRQNDNLWKSLEGSQVICALRIDWRPLGFSSCKRPRVCLRKILWAFNLALGPNSPGYLLGLSTDCPRGSSEPEGRPSPHLESLETTVPLANTLDGSEIVIVLHFLNSWFAVVIATLGSLDWQSTSRSNLCWRGPLAASKGNSWECHLKCN